METIRCSYVFVRRKIYYWPKKECSRARVHAKLDWRKLMPMTLTPLAGNARQARSCDWMLCRIDANPLPAPHRRTNDENKRVTMSQEKDIKEIISLGYNEWEAKVALKVCRNDMDNAIDYLFSGGKILNHENKKAPPVGTTTCIRQYEVVNGSIEQPPPVIRNDESVAAVENQTSKRAIGKQTILVESSNEERTTAGVLVGAFAVPGRAPVDVETPEEVDAQASAGQYFTATARVVQQSEEEELNMLEERVQTQEECIQTQEEQLNQLMASREVGAVDPVNENEERRQVNKVTLPCKLSKKWWRTGIAAVTLVLVAIVLAAVLS